MEKTSIHLFRHTFAKKYLVDCGGNAFTLQRLLGHSTLDMTKHYCTIFDADITKNYDSFSLLTQIKGAEGNKIKWADNMAEWAGSNPRPFFEVHFTTTICTLQLKQAILTVFVARTELPQQGQIYFRVLDGRGGGVVFVPLCLPVPVI